MAYRMGSAAISQCVAGTPAVLRGHGLGVAPHNSSPPGVAAGMDQWGLLLASLLPHHELIKCAGRMAIFILKIKC